MKSILICTNHRANPNQPSCGARGAVALKQQLSDAVTASGVALGVKEIQCLGECDIGPNLRLIPGGQSFHHVDADSIPTVLKAAKSFLKD
jgi:NADH:ubiquinone oxidoreductase subunit E